MSGEKKFKKGEFLVKEGEVPKTFFVIQSGKASVYIERGGQKVEIEQAGPGQIVGEQGIFGFPKSTYTYEAMSQVKVMELPVDPLKVVFEKSPAPLKALLKSLGEQIRRDRKALRGLKQDQENAPCPPRYIPRLCAILALVGKSSGIKPKVDPTMPAHKQEEEAKKNPTFTPDDLILNWSTLKIYTSRMFFESHQRMEHFLNMLSKFGYVTNLYEKNPDTEQDELANIRLHDIETIELFGDFYQHNFFKAGRSEAIHIAPQAYLLARALSELSVDAETDHRGAVKLDFKETSEKIKEVYHLEIKGTHFDLMEKKGLFLTRKTEGENTYFVFDKSEFKQMHAFWQLINEIDHWNEVGKVDMEIDYNEIKAHAGLDKCPSCKSEIKVEAKFCPECGHKLEEQAA